MITQDTIKKTSGFIRNSATIKIISIEIQYGEKKYGVNSGLKTIDIASAGVSSQILLSPTDNAKPFSFHLNLNGSEQNRLLI